MLNHFKRNRLIEFIRNKITDLEKLGCITHFGWIKGHWGLEGNEMVDKLAKEAALKDGPITYNKIPITSVATELKKGGLLKWQRQWEGTTKGALCRSFFPTVEQRLKVKLLISPEFTALVTGHGKTKAYLYRFKLTDSPTCPCNEGAQTPEHLIYTTCTLLESERSSLDKHITAGEGSWPSTNSELVTTHIDAFKRFVKSIDFTKLQ
jgi:hypothetical protein